MDDNWYARNRARDAIVHGARAAREVQLLFGLKNSEVFRIIAKVFRDTGGETVNVRLIYLIRELEKDERSNRQR